MNQETTNSCPEEYVKSKGVYDIDTLISRIDAKSIRKHNVGNSNYSTMPVGYQPWEI